MKLIGIKKLPQILYKYLDWKTVGAMNILTKFEIYFSSPSRFNDIFDCKIPISSKFNNEKYYEKYLFKLLMNENPLDPKNSVFRYLDQKDVFNPITAKLISSHYKMPIKKRTPNEFFETYLDVTTGVFSLSSVYNNNLMWGHYAASHAGICIGFFTNFFLELEADYIGRVTYTNLLPKLKPDLLSQENMENFFFTKELDWRYENEYRIVWRDIKERVVTFNPNSIYSIHLGYDIGMSGKMFIDLIKNHLPHIKIYKTIKDVREFKLKFIKI